MFKSLKETIRYRINEEMNFFNLDADDINKYNISMLTSFTRIVGGFFCVFMYCNPDYLARMESI